MAFKYKGHKSLEYCCQLFSNTVDIRKYNFSFASTISYAESNGGIFILIAPLGNTNLIQGRTMDCKITIILQSMVGQTASDLSIN